MLKDSRAVVVFLCEDLEVATWRLSARGRPDLAMLNRLARLQLEARRLGLYIRLRDASADLCALLDLMGLAEVIPAEPALLGRQVIGHPEHAEQGRVQEVVVPHDPVA